jgi:hypothetical protein
MGVVEGLTAARAGVDLAKRLMDAVNRPDIDVHDVRRKLQEMLIHVVNAQIALGEAQSEIADLERKAEDKAELKALENDVEYEQDGKFYVRKSERPKGLIPYCPACWGKDRILVAMAPYSKPGLFRCPLHEKTLYSTSAYDEWMNKQPQQQRAVRSGWLDRH